MSSGHGGAEGKVSEREPGVGGELANEQERILACVHCGFCLDVCPTYTRLNDEADSPRGRIYLIRALAEDRITPDSPALRTHLGRCLGCRACEPICPSDVQYGHLLERARATINGSARMGTLDRLLLAVFGHPAMNHISGIGGRILRGSGLAALMARLLPDRLGRTRMALRMLAASRPRPLPVAGASASGQVSVPEGVAARTAARARTGAGDADQRKPVVAMLGGCVQRTLYDRVNRATNRVLRVNGCEIVEAPGQGCCGALHAHAGDLEGARRLARKNVAAFEASGAETVVVNAAGCSAFMKSYGGLLEDDPASDGAKRVAGRVRDASEFLVSRGLRRGAAVPLRVAYDAPCHLIHAQRIKDAPIAMLEAIPGLDVEWIDGADECCGGAGTWGLANPGLGGRILRDKVHAVQAARADVVATPNPGCMMQIGAGLVGAGDRTPVVHPIELLAESYRRGGTTP